MLIGKNWKLKAENLNLILYRKKSRTRKDGQAYEGWELTGYFRTVKDALHELVEQEVEQAAGQAPLDPPASHCSPGSTSPFPHTPFTVAVTVTD